MRDRDTICFVEVRSRKSRTHGTAAETVGGVKQRRLILAARHWLARNKWNGGCRFDVVAIHGDDIELIKDAFRSS
jgi:putative endonuclease